jgi:beta-lactam-binding protein with PASTA domain
LLLGEIRYIPHQFQNAVLEQKLNGSDIAEGVFLAKGSKVDLVVGDGLGSSFSISNVIGSSEEDAKFILVGSGLKVGKVIYEDSDKIPNGTVIKQFPPAGQSVKIGDFVELIIAKGEAVVEDAIIGKELEEAQDE